MLGAVQDACAGGLCYPWPRFRAARPSAQAAIILQAPCSGTPPFIRPAGDAVGLSGTPFAPTASAGHGAQEQSRDATTCGAHKPSAVGITVLIAVRPLPSAASGRVGAAISGTRYRGRRRNVAGIAAVPTGTAIRRGQRRNMWARRCGLIWRPRCRKAELTTISPHAVQQQDEPADPLDQRPAELRSR